MFSLFNLMLVSHLLVMSDRDHFCDASKISKQTEITWDLVQKALPFDKKELKDKRILFVVHGFNNTSNEAIQTYRTVADHITALRDTEGNAFYDVVIGYLWPGYDDKLEYYAAKKQARKLKDKMLSHLTFLSSTASKVDVMAHSMGNCLMFEALNFSPKKKAKKLIKNFYSLAAAVDNESVEKSQKYFHVSKNCEDIYIFYSKKDEVLEFLYAIAEWDKALGFDGIENLEKMPKNMQLIDCTSFISGHSEYFNVANVYDYIRDQLVKQMPSSLRDLPNLPLKKNEVEILADEKKQSHLEIKK